jgi:hypothetical protein
MNHAVGIIGAKRKKKCRSMAYFFNSFASRPPFGARSAALIQSGRNFAGKLNAGWYVPLMICHNWGLAEDLIEQVGTTVK